MTRQEIVSKIDALAKEVKPHNFEVHRILDLLKIITEYGNEHSMLMSLALYAKEELFNVEMKLNMMDKVKDRMSKN